MNIYIIKFKNRLREHEFLASIIHFSEEMAFAFAKARCDEWGEDWTFEIILYREAKNER